MTQYLPPNLLALFAPRDPIPYLSPIDKLPHQKKTTGYSGVAEFLQSFEDPSETPPPVKTVTREERQIMKAKWKAESSAYKLEQSLAVWDPEKNSFATSDPYKTLFVARINYDTSESKLRREFERYGAIKKIHMVHNVVDGKSRGYAFIEYERSRDMHDGKKIEGRRVLVDYERGRSVKGWLPRRLGGGLGGTRRGGPEVNLKCSGRDEGAGSFRERKGEKERHRSRSRSRERRRRSTSRNRDRHRSNRDRDRERKHRRSRSRDRKHRERDRENRMDRDDRQDALPTEKPVAAALNDVSQLDTDMRQI